MHHAAGRSCCVATSSRGWGRRTEKFTPLLPSKKAAAPAYGRKSEEGDADERERSCQQPPVPGLWVLIPVADGGESNLQGEEHRTALGQPA